MNPVIQTHDVHKRYGQTLALREIDLEIPEGSFVLLVGHNGAGKTTLLRCLSGRARCQGELRILGTDPRRRYLRPDPRICYRAEAPALPRHFRIRDVVDLYDRIHPRFDRDRARRHLERAGLKDETQILATLSRGNLARVEAAILLSVDAELLLLDEPLAGLDPVYRELFWSELLASYTRGGQTVVLATHRPEDVSGLFTHLVVLQAGRLVFLEEADRLQERYRSVLVPPERQEEARRLHPLLIRPHWGRELHLYRDLPDTTLSRLGESYPTELSTIVQALLSPLASTEPPI